MTLFDRSIPFFHRSIFLSLKDTRAILSSKLVLLKLKPVPLIIRNGIESE